MLNSIEYGGQAKGSRKEVNCRRDIDYCRVKGKSKRNNKDYEEDEEECAEGEEDQEESEEDEGISLIKLIIDHRIAVRIRPRK